MRIKALLAVTVMGAGLLGTSLPATAVPPTTASPAPSAVTPTATITRATLTGLVRGADRKPVVGAMVEVFTLNGEFVNDARTNYAGTFSIPSLNLGSYRVRARPPSTRPWAAAWAPSAGSFLNAGTVNVRSFGGKVTLTLPYGGTIAGTVSGLTATATVTVCGTSFLDCRSAPTRRGAFRITNLPAGVVQVVVRLANGRALSFPAQPPRPGVRITAGRTLTIRLNAITQTAPYIVSR